MWSFLASASPLSIGRKANTWRDSTVDLTRDCLFGKVSFVKVHLGGKNDLVTWDILFNRPSEVFLARSVRIGVCRIKEIDAEFQCVPNDLFGLFGIKCPFMKIRRRLAEAHTANAEL